MIRPPIQENVRVLLTEYFTIDELKTLCFDLGIDFEELSGKTKSAKARELVSYAHRIGRFQDLLIKAKSERLHLPWPVGAPPDVSCPYPGLKPFSKDDAEHFWGREGYISQLIKKSNRNSIVAVIGQSGCGKTSLVNAGLIPHFQKDEANAIIEFEPGSDPFISFFRSLMTANATSSIIKRASEIESLKRELRTGNIDLDFVIDSVFELNPTKKRLIIFINQFEEIYTRCKEEEIRTLFLDKLVNLRNSQYAPFKITVVLTLRIDYLDAVMKHIPFVDKLQEGTLFLPLMGTKQLKKAIIEPAKRMGVKFESGLVERIIEDAGEEAGRLPLIQLSLQLLWDGQANGYMTHSTYESFGGVKSVINDTADHIFSQFTSSEKAIAYSIFMRLVEVDSQGRVSKRKWTSPGFTEQDDKGFQKVLDKLTQSRLLTINEESIQIAHEALFEEWEVLREWIIDNKRIISICNSIQQKAKEWQKERLDHDLLRGSSLREAEMLLLHFSNHGVPSSQNTRKEVIDRFTYIKYVYDKTSLESLLTTSDATLVNAFSSVEIDYIHSSLKANAWDSLQLWAKRFLLSVVVLIILPFIFGFLRIKLHDGEWKPVSGILGGRVGPIYSNDQAVFATVTADDKSTLFRSTDAGNSWTIVEGLPKATITDILSISQKNDQTIFVGTLNSGVFRNRNNGTSWEPVNEGLLNFNITHLLLKSDPVQTLFVATYGRNGGVYRSSSTGESWERVSDGLLSTDVSSLALDPVEGWIFAGTKVGLFRSMDGGDNWLPTQLSEIPIVSVKVDPFNHQIIYAAGQNGRFYKSVDSGEMWLDMSVGIPDTAEITAFSVSKFLPNTLYVAVNTFGGSRIFKINNGAQSWNLVSHGAAGLPVTDLLEQSQNGRYLVGTMNGLFRGDLSEDSWERLPVGLSDISVGNVVRREDGETFVVVQGGIFRSNNQTEWQFFNTGLIHDEIRVLYPDPADKNVLYIGHFAKSAQDSLFVSNNKGRSWHVLGSVNNGLRDDDVRDIEIDPNDPTTMYVVTHGSGVFKSTDKGKEWFPINAGITNPLTFRIEMDSNSPQTLYVIAVGGPVYRTTNGGQTWESLLGTEDLDIKDVAIRSNDEEICITVFGVQEGSIRCSSNGGESWRNLNKGINSSFVSQLEISPTDSRLMYAGTDNAGVFWSRNGGESWESINSGLPSGRISHLQVDPYDEGVAFASIVHNGVFELFPKIVFSIERN